MSEQTKQIVVYKTFGEFYPFYLREHIDPTNRRLHFIGTTLVMILALWIIFNQYWDKIWYLPVCGYGFAWVGHFFFEKNKPATFKYPAFSLRGDFQMWFDIVTGKQPLAPTKK